MNNNKISNPKVEVSKGTKLNDKDYMTSLLTCLKDMEKNYVIAMSEASNQSLYEKYQGAFMKISCLQRKTYQVMFQKGWYSLEASSLNKVSEKYNMLNQELSDLQNSLN